MPRPPFNKTSRDRLKDWGVLHTAELKWLGFRERKTFSAALEHDGEQYYLRITTSRELPVSRGSSTYSIPISAPREFVKAMVSGFQALDRLAVSPDTFAGGSSDKPPLAFGLLYLERVVHGIKASKLLLTQGDSSGRETLYTYYGFITRKKTQRIMIYCPSDIEQTDFIAGEAFRALVHALATWLDDPANARLVGKWEKGFSP